MCHLGQPRFGHDTHPITRDTNSSHHTGHGLPLSVIDARVARELDLRASWSCFELLVLVLRLWWLTWTTLGVRGVRGASCASHAVSAPPPPPASTGSHCLSHLGHLSHGGRLVIRQQATGDHCNKHTREAYMKCLLVCMGLLNTCYV